MVCKIYLTTLGIVSWVCSLAQSTGSFFLANAIVFLASMSVFDQALAEAPEVNHLEDTFLLWEKLCLSKLLLKVSIALLLNKHDIPEAMPEEGILFKQFIKHYTG